MHSVPDSSVHYGDCIDHERHDVTYVTTNTKRRTLPQAVPYRVVERPARNADLVTEVLAAVAAGSRPERIIALGESDIIAAAQIRDVLGIAGPKPAQALLVRDKVLMKSAVASAGLRVPRFLSLATGDEDHAVTWQGPTVLKPSAGAGSDGVVIYPSPAEALAAAQRLSTDDTSGYLEIEEFVPGPVIQIDGLMVGGQPFVLLPARYIKTCLSFAEGSPLGSVQFEPDADLITWTLRCLLAVGITDGPFHLEAIESKDGLTFLEVGARPPARGSVDAFELATGLRLPSLAVHLVVTGPDGLPAPRVPRPDELYGYFVFPRHRLHSHRILGASQFRSDPIVHQWFERTSQQSNSTSFTYTPQNAPLGGLIGPSSEPRMTRFLNELFSTVKVSLREAGD
ncbi:ATP-grasp domain-containing protein [Actinoallomurus rhizosphaericola]|uniref:ATP-grasp domain-containing protein n=1 Tax=Actinoallomurus rhizosphaericola TaxID=2952536 RepID=UPI002093CF9D|nr:hypothetical protein [Actinoallomurus rhizosphaericola]MCO5997984.1 hypothetical protein [Actinoallomurus rhizosphaericola]